MKKENILSEILNDTANILRSKGFTTPRLDAEVLLSHHLGLDRPGLYIHFHKSLSDSETASFRKLIDRRKRGEPVAYITGSKEFWSLPLTVSPDVLIPRPDTEVLVAEALGASKPLGRDHLDILEIGTGSGAVGIALAKELKNARIVATDISLTALHVAKKNAARHAVADRISFVQGNLFEPLSGKFDIIVSNPPYISAADFMQLPRGVQSFEPKAALLAGPKGTEFHEALIKGGRHHLTGGGWLIMEMGDGQKERVEFMLAADGVYDEVGFAPDYAGFVRIARARRKV